MRDSDATLLLSIAPELTGGSRQTMIFARQLAKPWLHLHPGMDWRSALQTWIDANRIAILNVAGPRASGAPAIGSFTAQALGALADMAAVHGSRLNAGRVQGNDCGVSGCPSGLRD